MNPLLSIILVLQWPFLLSVVVYSVARKDVRVDPKMVVVQIILEGEASSSSSCIRVVLDLFCLFVFKFQSVKLSEISESKKHEYHIISLICVRS